MMIQTQSVLSLTASVRQPRQVADLGQTQIMNRMLSAVPRPLKRLAVFWILWVMVFGTFGCSHLYTVDDPKIADYRPRHSQIDAVPFHAQQDFDCGPAALAMVLGWSGVSVSPATLAPQVLSPARSGTLQAALVAGARRYGRAAYEINGMEKLLEELRTQNPVIILQNLGFFGSAQWHYAVAIGYDLDQGLILLHSGKTARKPMPIRLFQETWKKSDGWGLVVMPASRIPASASENAVVAAMIGLEHAGQWQAAIAGYRATIARWPYSVPAHIGLANSYYASGDLPSAERVLYQALQLAPADGIVCNNLAQILWEQGKTEQARDYARKAVEIGGPHEKTFRATLEQIQSEKPIGRKAP
jgi:tetratricopeptide (TPR) repeat protein